MVSIEGSIKPIDNICKYDQNKSSIKETIFSKVNFSALLLIVKEKCSVLTCHLFNGNGFFSYKLYLITQPFLYLLNQLLQILSLARSTLRD